MGKNDQSSSQFYQEAKPPPQMDSSKEIMITEDSKSPSTTTFELDIASLRKLNEDKKVESLDAAGGLKGIATKLKTDLSSGLSSEEAGQFYATRIEQFGTNEIIEPPMASLFSLIIDTLKDPIMIILLIAALVSIFFGIFLPEEGKAPSKTGWIEGAAIFVAVFLVVAVGAGNDYSKERKFRALNAIKNDKQVKVRRNGKDDKVSINSILVGDIVILDTGDQVPADGLFISGHEVAVDESAMTGETHMIKKNATKPFFISGCQVNTGSGLMLVTATGMNSEWGITYSNLTGETDQTPLQEKLEDLAKLIGYVGMIVAGLLFIVLTIVFIVEHTGKNKFEVGDLRDFIKFLILCVTIVVVAVPEGLPLAVTIALAYSMKAMLKDNNLVRHLEACETMGGATCICSDKTGTLTENKMTVTSIYAGGKVYRGDLKEQFVDSVDKKLVDMLVRSSCLNSTAFLKFHEDTKKDEFIGSKTECALLVMSRKFGYDYNAVRKQENILTLFPFSSAKKRMSTVVEYEKGSRLYTKGASEMILALCTSYLAVDGIEYPLESHLIASINGVIEDFAKEGLRTLTIAYKNMDTTDFGTEEEGKENEGNERSAPDSNLVLLGIVGIEDPLRKEVPEAIETCKKAGITVRMVTGDNKITATKIAQDCGILNLDEGHVVMEGPEFRVLSDAQLDAVLPSLRVLARSMPTDKKRLVNRLKYLREVVAVTGDGTNDAPALREADVGFAMGIAGTEVAKEASDIIIMDDNFASIVKSVMWGRSVRSNIQRFLQFQLTINGVALIIAFISAVSQRGQPLSSVQLLWVNLIQDTMAALALATTKPTPDLLTNKPAGRSERLITPSMWRMIICTALFECAILFPIVYAGDKMFEIHEDVGVDPDKELTVRYTMVFNTFVIMAIFNEINARRLDDHWNAFENFFSNYIFLVVILITGAAQAIIIGVGDVAFRTVNISWKYWFICIGLGLIMIPFGIILRVCVPQPLFLKYEKKKVKGESIAVEEGESEMPITDKENSAELATISNNDDKK